MTKIFASSGYISGLNRCSWGMGKGIFLQHSEGRGYLDTDHCHGEQGYISFGGLILDAYTSVNATY